MYRRILLGVVVSLAGTGMAVAADTLNVGDRAPKIEVKEFLKGHPVTQFAKGNIYVVEFWATWCGPCRISIPHLTKLQKKYPAVTVIGVSIWEREPEAVKPFVKEMGDKMDYRVAVDKPLPKDKDDKEDKEGNGVMAKAWMDASDQDGIPTAFIVNGDGKIAWIGSPLDLDKPLEQVTAGKWDLAVAAADYKKDKARKARLNEIIAKLRALPDDDNQGALKIIDQALQQDPELEKNLGRAKFQLMAQIKGHSAQAVDYGKQLAKKFKEDADQLNSLAWTVVNPEAPTKNAKLLKFALEVAQLADEVSNYKDPTTAHILARAYFGNGQAAKAVETEQRVLKLSKGTSLEGNKDITECLNEYQKALPKK